MEGSRLLINEYPLQALPTLAKLLDLNKAVILQQIQYWIMTSPHEEEGHLWIYNSYSEWSRQFPWLSPRGVRYHIGGLEKAGLLIAGEFNRDPRDNTKWYRINYDKLEALLNTSGGVSQNVTPDVTERQVQVSQNVKPLPETTTENTTIKKPDKGNIVNNIFELMRSYLGYPDKIKIDPIPNYGPEGQNIKRLITRGYTADEIMDYWRQRVDKAGGFVSMVYVNKDIGAPARGNGRGKSKLPTEAELEVKARQLGLPQ